MPRVAGVGMTDFGKSSRSLKDLTRESVLAALTDAGIGTETVQAAYVGNAAAGLFTGQEMIRGQVLLKPLGISGIPVVNVENACASGSTAFHLGYRAVASGQYDVVLCVGAEKMTLPDPYKTLEVIGTAIDIEQAAQMREALRAPDDARRSIFMDLYAHLARRYMDSTGATVRHFATVAAKNQWHGSMNRRSQYGSLLTPEDVLASREVVSPLTLYMCSPVSDGAAAAVIVSDRVADRLGPGGIRVRASVLLSGSQPQPATKPSSLSASVRVAAAQAYEEAALGPQDIDLAEVHDATAPAEMIAYEELGFAAQGEGASLVEAGSTRLGGRMPVNPSGGLLSKGHPIGATGVAQICEAVWQLRGLSSTRQVDEAKIALTQNSGGWVDHDYAAVAIHILAVN